MNLIRTEAEMSKRGTESDRKLREWQKGVREGDGDDEV